MRFNLIQLTVILLSVTLLQAEDNRAVSTYGKLPLHFEPNRGQFEAGQAFRAKARGYDFVVTDRGAAEIRLTDGTHAVRVGLAIEGARAAKPNGTGPLEGHSNYIRGNNPAQWVQGVPHFASVRVSQIKPGIDIAYHADGPQLEYDFEIAPRADPSALRLRFLGAELTQIDPDGALRVKTAAGDLVQHKPVAWQTVDGHRRAVAAAYALEPDGAARMELGDYDHERALVIDPVLTYSTYFGGSGGDTITAIQVDSAGYAYIAGSTTSQDLPATSGTPPPSSSTRMFAAKLNPSGTALSYCTYIGGTGSDQASGLVLDTAGNAYLVGTTNSTDFPTIPATPGSTYNYQVVLKLSASGILTASKVLTSQFQGYAPNMAADAAGNLYIAGKTTTLATTPGAYNSSYQSASGNAFAMKLDQTLAILYATYLGNSAQPRAIATDATGAAYIAGAVPFDFNPTAGAYQTVSAGGTNAFVMKLNPNGGSLLYATYLGGPSYDAANAIAIDPSGNAYVAGVTGIGFPTTKGSYLTTAPGSGVSWPFIAKLNGAGSALLFSSYFGGDSISAIAVTASGAYLAGNAQSNAFPTTPGSLELSASVQQQAFFAQLNLTGDTLIYSTVLGSGDNGTSATALTGDANSGFYIAGSTTSANLATTPGAFQGTAPRKSSTSLQNGFVAKIDMTSATRCNASLSSTSFNAAAHGDSGSFTLTLNPGCPWTAFTDLNSPLHIIGPTNGISSATFNFTMDYNPYTYAPQSSTITFNAGTLTGAPASFTVSQPAATCADPVFTSSQLTFDSTGGSRNVGVKLANGCSWSVTGTPPWITVTQGTASAGAGNLALFVSANNFATRQATLTVAGKAITVTQTAGACNVSLSGSALYGTQGGTGVLPVAVSASTCAWTAYSLVPWIQVPASSASGQGNSAVPFLVAVNPGAASRSGQLNVGDQFFTVTQSAGSAGAADSLTFTQSVYAGTGTNGFSGDGGPALSAQLYSPTTLAGDTLGNLYVWDSANARIRVIDKTTKITTLAGGGLSNPGNAGPATQAVLGNVAAMAPDSGGNLFIAESNNSRVRRIDAGGLITQYAGTGSTGFSGDGGPPVAAVLYSPQGVALDGSGNVFIADTYNNRIREVSTGLINTIAGGATGAFAGDAGPAASSSLYRPSGLAFDAAGALYLADTSNCRIRKIGLDGKINTIAGTGTCAYSNAGATAAQTSPLYFPSQIAIDPLGTVYFLEGLGTVKRIGTDGMLSTISSPSAYGLAVDSSSNLYVSSFQQIYKLTPAPTFCNYSVSPAAPQTSGGGTLTLQITTAAGCAWNAGSSLPWATLTGATSGTGSGQVFVTVSANTGTTSRTGTVAVAGQLITVAQNASNTSSSLFVTALYSDLLNRAPDSGGLTFWSSNIDNGNFTRSFVGLQFFNSPEFTNTGLYLIKLYLGVLGRDPDFSGWNYWFTAYRAGLPLATVLNSFLSGPEFQATYGGLSNAQFVNLVYQKVLGRAPDAGGQAYWLNLLNTNQVTRGAMMDSFIRGTEFDTLVKSRAYANLLYMGFLRRNADVAGLAYWSGILKDLSQLQAVVNGFISGPEYNARF